MKLRTLQALQALLSKKWHWHDHGRLLELHISKHSLFSSQDRGRLSDKHISKHSLFHVGRNSEDHGRLPDEDISKHSHEKTRADTLKSTVGGPSCTCPSIHRKTRADTLLITFGCPRGAHVQAFTEKLALTQKITVG